MRSLLALSLVVSLVSFGACTKGGDDKKPAPAPAAATVTSDGVRHVPIGVNKDGYSPDKIVGKPGEKLVLVFTRTFEADCISQVKAPDGKLFDLPLNKPVEVAVTVPQTGEVGFACGMDMFHGVVAAQP